MFFNFKAVNSEPGHFVIPDAVVTALRFQVIYQRFLSISASKSAPDIGAQEIFGAPRGTTISPLLT